MAQFFAINSIGNWNLVIGIADKLTSLQNSAFKNPQTQEMTS